MAASQEKHYVLVVHGTWNSPQEGTRLWYQLNDADPQNFCSQLNARLEEFGLGGSVWRPLNGEPTDFSWSGANRHEDRIVAARQLAKRIVEIATADPSARIHIVAHSHGGNVALGAIQLYLSYLHWQAQIIWNIDDLREWRSLDHREREYIHFFEGPESELLPVHLPPAKEHALAFGLENKDLLAKRWHEARDEYSDDILGPGRFQPAGLGHFKSWWAQHPKHNRLGRLVFLGTPFLYKRFHARPRWGTLAIEVVPWLVVFAVLAYLLIVAAWLLLRLAGFFPAALYGAILNPLTWPIWLHGAWLAVAFLAYGSAVYFTSSVSEVNLYCEDTLTAYLLSEFRVFMRSKPVLPLKALVITSGFLDEALLAMLSESIIKAVLDDRVHRFVFEKANWASFVSTGSAEGVFAPAIRRAGDHLRAAVSPLLRPVKTLVVRYLRQKLFELVKSAGFGISPAELYHASVDVEMIPRLRRIIDDYLWLVTDDLAREAPSRAERTAEERYAFLWDDDKLREQSFVSPLLKQLWPLLTRRDPDLGVPLPLDDPTARVILTLEERMRELLGLVDLSHSHYYSNRRVIAGIARFIATGELPEGVVRQKPRGVAPR
jgi:hypothetical protein